jgi:beta-mannosidase
MSFDRRDLSQLRWTLGGWVPYTWRLRRSTGVETVFVPEFGPVPARVPGSVQAALLKAGIISDWTIGLNCYGSEWIERRHWEFSTVLPAAWFPISQPVWLRCEGLDYRGTVLVNGKEAGRFEGTLIPHAFDLTPFIQAEAPNTLSIIFEGAPDEQAQIGYTSKTRYLKPRFAYSWDWCPRMVGLGVWDGIHLEIGGSPRLLNVRPKPRLKSDLESGELKVECRVWSGEKNSGRLCASLKKDGKEIGSVEKSVSFAQGENIQELKFPPLQVLPWNPNGEGPQSLYDLSVQCVDQAGTVVDHWEGRTGFKRVRWLPCEGAAKDALPWLCEVNGNRIFLQGVNWTPIRMNYHDLRPADYERRLRAYARMGCNLLRVWGGGLIEKREFYDLCDRLGLMVWQEFPLSSSGLENTPPDDPAIIRDLVRVAQSAIERRGGHVSLLQWCGGNELMNSSEKHQLGDGQPWDERHPCLKALGDTVRKLDPGTRFLPTSPFGPIAHINPSRYGQGIHHDVHGPWKLPGSYEDWCAYWDRDDALFHAEMGAPSASPLDLLERYRGECRLWPPSNKNIFWRRVGSWWVEPHHYQEALAGLGPKDGIAQYVRLSQDLQARALSYAVKTLKGRFPSCAGCLIWMGHDCFPCGANTSILDFHGRPKPAAKSLGRIFRSRAGKTGKITRQD